MNASLPLPTISHPRKKEMASRKVLLLVETNQKMGKTIRRAHSDEKKIVTKRKRTNVSGNERGGDWCTF